MSKKEPIRAGRKAPRGARQAHAGAQADQEFNLPANPAAALARAEAGGGALHPGDVPILQRTIGNQAVNRLMTEALNSHPVIQRTQGDASKLAEGEYAEVTSGKSITFTKLSAGCMAMVVFYNGGGGVGYHLAMKIDNASQWSEFLGVIGAKGVTEVHLSSEFIGQAEGWYVKYDIDEGEPDTSVGPRSYAELFAQLQSNDAIRDAGWVSASGAVSEWFKEKFGVAPKISTKTEVQIQVS